MAHQRALIRAAVTSALVSANTAAGSRVYPTRFVPLRTISLPALAVYTLEESIDPESWSTAPKRLTRNMRLMVEGFVTQNTGMDDALDALAVQIERAMDADDSFGGLCNWSLLETCEIDIFEEGQKEIGLIRMVYSVRYYTDAPDDSDVTLDDLDTVDAKTYPSGSINPVEDTITNLES